MSVPAEPFTYVELPNQSIRLLEIVESEDDPDWLSLQLRTYQLVQAPAFNALSYTWGSPTGPTFQVLCRDVDHATTGSLQVRSNLHTAFPFLKAASSRPIWIDAVCINQDNAREKERVIPIMGDYYRRAAEVLVWLGPASDRSEEVMDIIEWCNFPARRGTLTIDPHIMEVCSAANTSNVVVSPARCIVVASAHGPEPWVILNELFQREWFSRIWTCQELLLADRATILCGNRPLPWEVIGPLGRELQQKETSWIVIQHKLSVYEVSDSFDCLHEDQRSFSSYLGTARDRSCYMKEHRIFGLLALAPPKIRARIEVKHDELNTESYIETYHQAAIACLKQGESLSDMFVLAIADDKPSAMPSWCSDWSRPANIYDSSLYLSATIGPTRSKSWKIDPGYDTSLLIRGRVTAVALDVVPRPPNPSSTTLLADVLGWLNDCEPCVQRSDCVVDSTTTRTSMAETLFFGASRCDQRLPMSCTRALDLLRRNLYRSVKGGKQGQINEEKELLWDMGSCTNLFWHEHSFFTTAGPAGTFGLATCMGMVKGDLIVPSYATKRYIVLGRREDGETYKFKGYADLRERMLDSDAFLDAQNPGTTREERVKWLDVR